MARKAELHDYMGEERGRSIGIPLDEFINQVFPQLQRSEEHTSVGIPNGVSAEDYQSFVATRKKMFDDLSDVLFTHFQI